MKLRRLWPLFAIALLVGFLYSRGGVFRVTRIEIDVPDERFKKTLQEQFVSLYGRDLFSLSLNNLEKDLRILPRVESVVLHRKWPSTLLMKIELRAIVAVQFFDKQLWLVDDAGHRIEPLRNPEAVPVLGPGFLKDAQAQAQVCAWLKSVNKQDLRILDATKIDQIDWSPDRGAVLTSSELGADIELGFKDFSASLLRADIAIGFFKDRGMNANFYDSSSVRRVVVRGLSENLQNPQSGLNLREIVRRKDSKPAAAR